MSIKAGKGKVFGMPGANGAGKSTTIECILGTKIADSGSVSILGCDPRKDRRTLSRDCEKKSVNLINC